MFNGYYSVITAYIGTKFYVDTNTEVWCARYGSSSSGILPFLKNSRSMTPITWQAAVDDEEQRPLLQDILEAAVDDRRQAAVDAEEQQPQPQDILEAAINGNHV